MVARPNFLWIVTTQWRAQAFGHAGDPNARTPHLDALAARSIHYTQAVTPHPFGPFARAALLTGKLSPENGVRDYFDPLPSDARTIAHAMMELDYTTAFFGKWHLGRRDPAAPLVGEPHARMIVPAHGRGGFDLWEGFESGFQLNNPWLHGSRLPEPVQVHGYQSDVLCDRAAAWIHAEGRGAAKPPDRPWFCVVSLEPPHPPYDAPAGDVSPRHPAGIKLAPNVPRGGEVEAKARRELAGYYAHIESTDRAIGRLLSAIKDTAIVMLTSVHGDMHGAHGLFRKGWPHEESVRVPLLIAVPGAPPRRDQTYVSLADLGRMTLGMAVGRAVEEADAPAHLSMPSVVALPHQCDRVWSGCRTSAFKLVLNADGSPWLFFDLHEDPFESNNLVAEPGCAGRIGDAREQFLAQNRG
jgi:arylsulfatase A-like enzyme